MYLEYKDLRYPARFSRGGSGKPLHNVCENHGYTQVHCTSCFSVESKVLNVPFPCLEAVESS